MLYVNILFIFEVYCSSPFSSYLFSFFSLDTNSHPYFHFLFFEKKLNHNINYKINIHLSYITTIKLKKKLMALSTNNILLLFTNENYDEKFSLVISKKDREGIKKLK